MYQIPWTKHGLKKWHLRWLYKFAHKNLPDRFKPNHIQVRPIGSQQAGTNFLQGSLSLDGEHVRITHNGMWELATTNQKLVNSLHSFQWLNHLASVGTPEAATLARSLVTDWMRIFGQGRGNYWHPILTSQRLTTWTRLSWFLLSGQEKIFHDQFAYSVARQANYLRIVTPFVSSNSGRLEVIVARLFAAKFLDQESSQLVSLHDKLFKELSRLLELLHESQPGNPIEWLRLGIFLTWIIEINETEELQLSSELMSLAIKLGKELNGLSHCDGSLVHLNGGHGTNAALTRQTIGILLHGQYEHQPCQLGYGKLLKHNTSVYLNTHNQADGTKHQHSELLPAAFEMQSNGAFICVNPGYHKDFEDEMQFQAAFTTSHNTLFVLGQKPLKRVPDNIYPTEFSPRMYKTRVVNEGDFQSISTTHGRFLTYGYYHQRQIKVNQSGEKIIGSDKLLPDQKGIMIDLEYAIYFNFHERIQAYLHGESKILNLLLPNGDIWEFNIQGKGRLDWGEGIYLNIDSHRMVTTQKLEVKHNTKGCETDHIWYFRKISSAQKLTDDSQIVSEEKQT